MTIQDFVQKYADRGECNCGRCLDRGQRPDPVGHVADLIFFKVGIKPGATAEEMRKLTGECKGEFTQIDPLDGDEHGYIELGAWIGSQDLALQFMGLASLLGIVNLLTPITVLKLKTDTEAERNEALNMAGLGLLTIRAVRR